MNNPTTTEKTGCYLCKYFTPLLQPIQRPDGATIYGYCAKNVEVGRGACPVYLPEGYCKERILEE